MDLPEAIDKVVNQQDLNRDEMNGVMRLIMTGAATDAQIGGFLVGLRMKGETVEELTAAATVMRDLATPVHVDSNHLVDTCGTGGSGTPKFNISTAAALVTAAAGAKVAKHGNRKASGKSGSADVLEAAGVNIDVTAEEVARCIDHVGVGFLFALNHHSAMKHAIGPRREMVTRTIFNLLGPLTNPAGAKCQLIGVYAREWVRPIAETLRELGSDHVLVVHSADGLDEISNCAESYVAELKDGKIEEYVVTPEQFGMQRGQLAELLIDDTDESLEKVKEALSGNSSAVADVVLLNAGAAIYAANLCESLEAGVEMARDAVGSGMAKEKLSELGSFTRHLGGD